MVRPRRPADGKDHIGVTVLSTSTLVDPARNVSVEYVRSPSPADGWHDRNGYVGSPQAVEAFLYDVRGGQPGRFTHEF